MDGAGKSIGLVTDNKMLAAEAESRWKADNWVPYMLDDMEYLGAALEGEQYYVWLVLDEPDDAAWAKCVEYQDKYAQHEYTAGERADQIGFVVVLTASDDDAQQFREAGADVVLTKPCSLEDIYFEMYKHVPGSFADEDAGDNDT